MKVEGTGEDEQERKECLRQFHSYCKCGNHSMPQTGSTDPLTGCDSRALCAWPAHNSSKGRNDITDGGQSEPRWLRVPSPQCRIREVKKVTVLVNPDIFPSAVGSGAEVPRSHEFGCSLNVLRALLTNDPLPSSPYTQCAHTTSPLPPLSRANFCSSD